MENSLRERLAKNAPVKPDENKLPVPPPPVAPLMEDLLPVPPAKPIVSTAKDLIGNTPHGKLVVKAGNTPTNDKYNRDWLADQLDAPPQRAEPRVEGPAQRATARMQRKPLPPPEMPVSDGVARTLVQRLPYQSAQQPAQQAATAMQPTQDVAKNIAAAKAGAAERQKGRSSPTVLGQAAKGLIRGNVSVWQSLGGTMLRYAGGKTGIDEIANAGKKVEEFFEPAMKAFEADAKLQGSILENPGLMKKPAWWSYNIANILPSFGASIIPGAGAAKVTKAIHSNISFGKAAAAAIKNGDDLAGYLKVGLGRGKIIKNTEDVAAKLARIGKASRVAGAAVGGLTGGALEGSSTYREAYDAVISSGGDEETARQAAELSFEQMTAASGLLNALAVGRFLSRAEVKAKIGEVGQRAISGLVEGLTEYLEGPAEAGILYNQELITPEQAVQKIKDELNVLPPSMVIGFLVPGLGGNLATVDQGKDNEVDAKKPVDTSNLPDVDPNAGPAGRAVNTMDQGTVDEAQEVAAEAEKPAESETKGQKTPETPSEAQTPAEGQGGTTATTKPAPVEAPVATEAAEAPAAEEEVVTELPELEPEQPAATEYDKELERFEGEQAKEGELKAQVNKQAPEKAPEASQESEAAPKAVKPLETAKEGEAVQVFDIAGRPITATLVGRSKDSLAIKVKTEEGKEEILGSGTLSEQDVNSPDFKLETGIVQVDAQKLSDLDAPTLDAAQARVQEKFDALLDAGQATTPSGYTMLQNLNALKLERKRRGAEAEVAPEAEASPEAAPKEIEPTDNNALIEAVNQQFKVGASAKDVESEEQAIIRVPTSGDGWLSDNESDHDKARDDFREEAQKNGWVEIGHSKNRNNYGYEVDGKRVELYKSGKDMGWSIQVDPPNADWKKATKVLVTQDADQATDTTDTAEATLTKEELNGMKAEPLRQMLLERNLSTSGTNKAKVKRLLKAQEDQLNANTTTTTASEPGTVKGAATADSEVAGTAPAEPEADGTEAAVGEPESETSVEEARNQEVIEKLTAVKTIDGKTLTPTGSAPASKERLKTVARSLGISTQGNKIDLAQRIKDKQEGKEVEEARFQKPNDPRLKRSGFRGALERMRDELIHGGGAGALVREDAYVGEFEQTGERTGEVITRTKSENPAWFQDIAAEKETKVSVKQVQKIINKALNGDVLDRRRELPVFTQILDQITSERNENTESAKRELDAARAERKSIFEIDIEGQQQSAKIEKLIKAAEAKGVDTERLTQQYENDAELITALEEGIKAGGGDTLLSAVDEGDGSVTDLGEYRKDIQRKHDEIINEIRMRVTEEIQDGITGSRIAEVDPESIHKIGDRFVSKGPAVVAGKTMPGQVRLEIKKYNRVNDDGTVYYDVEQTFPDGHKGKVTLTNKNLAFAEKQGIQGPLSQENTLLSPTERDTATGDLFGDNTSTKQGLADAEQAKDAKRNTGQESVETGRADDLFSEAKKQADIEDVVTSPTPVKSVGKGMTTQDVFTHLFDTIKTFQNIVSINVAETVDDLPQHIPKNSVGAWTPGKNEIWLVADRLKDGKHAEQILVHELFGHKTMEMLPNFKEVVASVQEAIGENGDTVLRQLSSEVSRSHPDVSDAIHAREIIARLAQTTDHNSLSAGAKRVLGQIRKMLNNMGFKTKFSDADLLYLINKSAQAATAQAESIALMAPDKDSDEFKKFRDSDTVKQFSKAKTDKERESLLMTLSHGSSASRRDKVPEGQMTDNIRDLFDEQFIGDGTKGEGATAYGHGLYFAENPEVAKSYQHQLTPQADVFVDGKKWGEFDAYQVAHEVGIDTVEGNFRVARAHSAMQRVGRHGGVDEAINEIDTLIPGLEKTFPKEVDNLLSEKEFLNKARDRLKVGPKQKGHFFDVVVPDETIGKMLDWDAPLSEQPELMKALDFPVGSKHPTLGVFNDGELTGNTLYKLAEIRMGSAEAASKALNEAGIPGIRFLDGSSRNVVGATADGPVSRLAESIHKANGGDIEKTLDSLMEKYPAFDRDALKKALPDTLNRKRNIVVFNPDSITEVKRDGELVYKAGEAAGETMLSPQPSVYPPDDIIGPINDKVNTPTREKTFRERFTELKHKLVSMTKEEWSTSMKYYIDNLTQGLIDSGNAIKVAERAANGGQLLDASISAYKQYSTVRNLPTVMAMMMHYGVPTYNADKGTFVSRKARVNDDVWGADEAHAFEEIWAPLRKLTADKSHESYLRLWEMWALSSKAKRLITEDKAGRADGTQREKNFNEAEVDAYLGWVKEQTDVNGHNLLEVFKEVSARWVVINTQVLDLARDLGVVRQEDYDNFFNEDYVPFWRALESMEHRPGPSGKGVDILSSGIKRMFGGTDEFGDPLKLDGQVVESMFLNSASLIDRIYRNEAMKRIADLGVKQGLMTKIPKKIAVNNIPPDELARLAYEAEFISAESYEDAQAMIEAMTKEEQFKIGRWFGRERPVADNIVTVFDRQPVIDEKTQLPVRDDKGKIVYNDKPTYYRVDDKLYLRSIKGISQENLGGIMTLLRGSKRVLTTGVTTDPAFMIANSIRDTVASWIVSEVRTNPFSEFLKSAKEAYTVGPQMLDLMYAGRGGGQFYDTNPDQVRSLLKNFMPDKEIPHFMQTIITPRNWWEAWKKIGNASELLNRMTEVTKRKEAGYSDADALWYAQDLLNFTRSGDFKAMQVILQSVPFMNARIQGLNRMVRGAKDNPTQFMMKGGGLAVASLALALKNDDDDRYNDLPEWDKDAYFHFFIGDEHLRVPKPFEVGFIFGTIPERSLRLMHGEDEGDWKLFKERMLTNVLENLNFNPIPQAAKPLIEQFANKSMFTGSPIVGLGVASNSPEAQYDARTFEIAKQVADGMPDSAPEWLRSPKRLEAATRGYFGALGTYMLGMSSMMVDTVMDNPERPSKRLSDQPVLKRFIRGEVPYSTKWDRELWESLNDADEIANSIRKYKSEGLHDKAQTLQQNNRHKLVVRKRLRKIGANIREINAQMERVRLSGASPETKRDRLDRLQERKNRATKSAAPFLEDF